MWWCVSDDMGIKYGKWKLGGTTIAQKPDDNGLTCTNHNAEIPTKHNDIGK